QQVRWQVSLPSNLVPLVVGENLSGAHHWAWRSWLLTPQPEITSTQLDEWLTAQPTADSSVIPSLVLARSNMQPLYLFRLPQQVWFVLCSGLLLVLGLGLNFSRLSPYTAGVALLLLGLSLVFLGLFLPSLLPAVLYGCEPGAVVLILLFVVQWM